MRNKKLAVCGFLFTLLGSTILLGTTAVNSNTTNKTKESRLDALAKYTKIVGTVEQYYVDDLTISEIINKSIEGLISNLDAHSGYLDSKKFESLKVQTDGEFGGIGFTIGMKDGAVTVIAPIEDTPADRAGIKSGDIILKIDDTSTLNMTIDEAVTLMRGKPKTKVTLTIVRKGEQKPLIFNLERDMIKVESVYSRMIEGENILYLRITNFDKNVETKTKEVFSKHKNITGVIMDLRNNPGGLLDQAVKLTDLFVDNGTIVSQKGREKSEDIVFSAKKGMITDKSLVVLVNGGSASASEIVSGSLQDHKRAIIVGEQTFGKGSVQAVLPVSDTEAIRLTIARYYLPSGRTIQATGVEPDVTVYPGSVPHDENDFSIKEVDLKKHLEGELDKVSSNTTAKNVATNTTSSNDTKGDDNKSKEIISSNIVLKDLQLKSAIDIIKVLNLTSQK
ncbi:MAG: S41 family peptidase [Campylobacteraceae bacterium]